MAASSADRASPRFKTGSSATSSPHRANQRRAFATAWSGAWRAAAVGRTNAGPAFAASTSRRSVASLPGPNSAPPTSASGPLMPSLGRERRGTCTPSERAAASPSARGPRSGGRGLGWRENGQEASVHRYAQLGRLAAEERPDRGDLIDRAVLDHEVPLRPKLFDL